MYDTVRYVWNMPVEPSNRVVGGNIARQNLNV
jgi:hypothetical protein